MIHPLLFCGGSGTRLWPLSRQNSRKQFVELLGEEILFQSSARRISAVSFSRPVIVTSEQFSSHVSQQLAEVEIEAGSLLIELAPRNTAPAVLAAATWPLEVEDDALMLVAPSDHVVPDEDSFGIVLKAAVQRFVEKPNWSRPATASRMPEYSSSRSALVKRHSRPMLQIWFQRSSVCRTSLTIVQRDYIRCRAMV